MKQKIPKITFKLDMTSWRRFITPTPKQKVFTSQDISDFFMLLYSPVIPIVATILALKFSPWYFVLTIPSIMFRLNLEVRKEKT